MNTKSKNSKMRSPFWNVGNGVHVSIEVKQLVHLMIEMDKLGFFSHLKRSGEDMFDPESLGKFMETFLSGDKFSVKVELNTTSDTPSDNIQ